MFELENSTVYFRDSFVPFPDVTLHVASAPMLYGLSIYTVFPALWNADKHILYAFRLENHFRRLQNSAKIMSFDYFLQTWTYPKFKRTILELLQCNNVREDVLVRISIFADGILTGTRMQGVRHEMSAFIYPAAQFLPPTGAHLCVSSWQRTADNAIPSRAKINGSYVNASLIKQEALDNGFDDAVALDGFGHVTESSVANIFLMRDGRLITPSTSSDLLEGITRDSIIKMAADSHLPTEQRSVDRSELYLADEMFLCGSSMKITPVLSVDHRQIGNGKIGPITKKLMRHYTEIGRSNISNYNEWLTPVPTAHLVVV